MIGAVLAGGRGARMGGGGKATVLLRGRPLVERAVAALAPVVGEERVVVVAKRDTPLPGGLAAPVWEDEAAEDDHHPRHGIVRALRGAAGAPVLVLAVDLPCMDAATLAGLRDAGALAREDGPGGRVQPLCGVYGPEALAPLAAAPPGEPLTRTVLERLRPPLLDVPGALLLNVNVPGDLARAEALGSPPACEPSPPPSRSAPP